MQRSDHLKSLYHLTPHPEGGAFSEVYIAPFSDVSDRSTMGSIFFLLEGDDISHLHVIDCDELWYYHEGCGMRVTMIDEAGNISTADLGMDAEKGQTAMLAIPAGVTFAAENLDKSSYTFVSCATSPKFRYEGFRLIDREALYALCGERAKDIEALAYEE